MKIYLAKSNKTTPFRVNLVRQCLSNLGVEVLEHDPKKPYSDTTLLSADYLMILPETPSPFMAVIGKGLASQINTWKHHKGSKDNILIMSSVEITDLRACGLDNVEITNSRDWTNYAQMYGEVYEEDSLANSIKRLQSKEETDNISVTSKIYGQFFEDEILGGWGSAVKDIASFNAVKDIASLRPPSKLGKGSTSAASMIGMIDEVSKAVKPKDQPKMYGQFLGTFIGFTGKVYSRRILIA
jgi:hypothetical protein